MTTGLLYDPIYLEHDTGPGHPECSQRLVATMQYLEKQPWFPELQSVTPQRAELKWIETTHSRDYIRRVQKTCAMGEDFLDSMDTGISRKSYDVALMASGGALALADRVVAGELQNGFGLLRPPGHHAEKEMALGFCLFNNVAIVARYLQQQQGLDKILILDWDVHHGNGTQHTFYDDPSVLYISTHQFPFYPGTGSSSETGSGRGTGYTLNCPMRAGSGNQEYEQAFHEKILPKIDEFKPEFIIISAGFDAHREDPLANINLTTDFFGWMTKVLMEKADLYAQGRIISLLEGGYNLQRLPECIAVHLLEMSEKKN